MTPDERKQYKKEIRFAGEATRQCFCIGPQEGQTLCPCKLRAQQENEIMKGLRKLGSKEPRP